MIFFKYSNSFIKKGNNDLKSNNNNSENIFPKQDYQLILQIKMPIINMKI